MKNKKMIMLSEVVVIIIIIGIVIWKINTTNMEFAEQAEAVYRYNGSDITASLSSQELSFVRDIFDGHIMYRDNPSCGFTEDVAIRVNDSETFCLACDTCPIIHWKEMNIYFKISEEQKEQLYDILKNYGFVFPCV